MPNERSIHSGGDATAGLFTGGWLGRAGNLAQYRTVIYLATFLSGAVSLTFQVVWQRYLSFMVGSEARSISLVVAVFLLGLATGYRFWGNFTARGWDRRTMLKAVGYIELGIAGYGILFPSLFLLVRDVAYMAPDLLIVDFAATAVLVFLPTFLMGASIPLLTAAVPASMQEVNYCHTRIYGINTLGAFLGAFVAGFILVPTFGLSLSLYIGAIVNMGVGLAFVLNNLQGAPHEGEPVPPIPHRFGASGIYLFVFVTGAVTIAFEVLFMRVLALSIGSGHYVFPIVVGIVILGLAIGSLSIRRGSVTANRVIRDLVKLSVLLVLVYFTVPFWPYWISHMRVVLVTIPATYPVFLTLVVLFTALLLLPIVIPMGRLLPMGYSLIDKESSDYGKLCGRVYFSNTIGTVVGAVGIGYLLLIVLDVDSIFVLNIALVLALAAYLSVRQRMFNGAAVCAVLAGLVLFLPLVPYGKWDRQLHVQGIFRDAHVRSYHFQGLLTLPPIVEEEDVLYFRDDPSVTVAATRVPGDQRSRPESRTIFVNGKSDGNTVADYSNMALTALLPYLYATKERDLDAAVIGLGMGITSGALCIVEDTRSVVTLEISAGVIEAVEHFQDYNFGLLDQEKSTLIKTDAFRYFTRTNRTFDLIISEPSNPWVVGVENLFTPEFYTMIAGDRERDLPGRLNPGGIFFQWLQIYEMDSNILAAIVRNVAEQFEHVSLYVVGQYDVGIIASDEPLTRPHMSRRMQDAAVQRILWPMAIEDEDILTVLQIMQTDQIRSYALSTDRPFLHSMDRPWLGHAAGRARFLQRSVNFDPGLLVGTGRHLIDDPRKREAFERLGERYGGDLRFWCGPAELSRHSRHFVCEMMEALLNLRSQLRRPLTHSHMIVALPAYHQLREQGLILPDLTMLERMRGMLFEAPDRLSPEDFRAFLWALAREYGVENQWDTGREIIAEAREEGLVRPDEAERMEHRFSRHEMNFHLRMALLSELFWSRE